MQIDERIKSRRVTRNIAAGVVYQAVSIAVGLVIPRLYLTGFGSEVNGLIATLKQVFAYLALVEAGLGMTVSQALYRPVALGRTDEINAILSAADRCYKRTGFIYGAIVSFFALIYPMAARADLPRETLTLIILIYGFPGVLSFSVHGKFQLLIDAEGKSYLLSWLQTALELVVSAARIALLLFCDDLVLIQAYICVGPVVRSAFVMAYSKKHYPWLNMRVRPNEAAIEQKSDALVHQAAGLVLSNTDAILLSVFCDFKAVSVYAIYQMFFSHIERLLYAVASGAAFRLGQMFSTDRRAYIRWHDLYETLYLMGAFAVYTMSALFLLPVVRLYTAGIGDARYADPALPLLFACANLLSSLRQPSLQTIAFAGHFRQTRRHAVMEAAINLAVSLAAVARWGIYGCLAGTLAAAFYRAAVSARYANERVLGRAGRGTRKKWLVNGAVFALIVGLFGRQKSAAEGVFALLGRIAAGGIAVLAAYAAANFAAERRAFRAALQSAGSERGKHPPLKTDLKDESHKKW